MTSLPGERLLYESAAGNLKVTTHRVRYESKRSGRAIIKSIMLEEIASCAMIRKSYPWLLILAALCLFGGLLLAFAAGVGVLVVGLFGAIVLGGVYLLTCEQVMAICSAGTTIFLNTQGWALQEVRDLIDQVEAAKNTRYLAVKGYPVAVAKT